MAEGGDWGNRALTESDCALQRQRSLPGFVAGWRMSYVSLELTRYDRTPLPSLFLPETFGHDLDLAGPRT